MINQIETLDRTIAKINRDLGLGQLEIPYQDFIEWIAEALQHIGSYYQFVEKEVNLLVENYQALLPCDLYKVIRLKEGCHFHPPGPGGFYGGSLQQTLCSAGFNLHDLDAYNRFHVLPVAGLSKPENLFMDEVVNGLQHNKSLIGDVKADRFTKKDFNVQLNLITTGFRDGIITVSYLAFPVDDRGWPMVPDNVSFRDALFWKVAYHISMRDPSLVKGRLQDSEYCFQKWNRYCIQARAAANMPDLMMTERLKNGWMRLHNTVDADRTGYRGLGNAQHLNLNGRF